MFKIEKGYDAVTKTFRLPADLVDELELLAQQNKISLNKLVIQSLQYALDNIDREDMNDTDKRKQ